MADGPRLTLVREDLKTQITAVYPAPKSIIIVHPIEGVQFNQDFANWIAETLKQILPVGVQGMVLAENVTKFEVLKPTSDNTEYVNGWKDAIKMVAELNVKN